MDPASLWRVEHGTFSKGVKVPSAPGGGAYSFKLGSEMHSLKARTPKDALDRQALFFVCVVDNVHRVFDIGKSCTA